MARRETGAGPGAEEEETADRRGPDLAAGKKMDYFIEQAKSELSQCHREQVFVLVR